MTVLSVSRDPGQPIVFFGYTLLLIGMCTVLATRIVQARELARVPAGSGRATVVKIGSTAALVAALALVGSGTAGAASADADTLRRLPVQHDGRVMPLDTLAREAVWKATGYKAWSGMDPVATVLAWTFDSQTWANTPVVKLGSRDLALAAGWPAQTTHASFMQLVSNAGVMRLMSQARQEAAQDKKLHGVLQDAQNLESRLVWMQGFLEQRSIRPIPDPSNPNAQWGVPEHLHGASDLAALFDGPRPAGWLSAEAIEREIRYNAVRPTRIAWWILAVALVVSIFAWNYHRRWLDAVSLVGLVAGFAVMTWGIGTRWAIGDRIPASNMYESLLFLGWGVGLFALIAFVALRNRIVVANANAMALLTMALTDLLPIDGFVHPVPPVLSGTPWLAIHVPIIMVSYSVLALAVVFAHMQIGFSIFAPRRTEVAAKMGELLYWYTHVGSILLIAGILTGSIWAASSWGRYWGWDPKEVWSLVAFLAYIAILHARFDRQIGSFAIAAWSIVAFQTILMTYLGVNFVLTAGLHSYGFGGSRIVNVMVMVALA
jgi:cytochrome c-type biogenesis protein CcsB